ncbi:MAG TPA: polysaccharide biosynthesis tyrosine autokinase [bacterium]|nr:polysaccharide biosynthesis tyrosine autokinase [bacterium]
MAPHPETAPSVLDEELNLRDLMRVAFSHARLIGYVTAGFVALALLYAFFWPKTYQATTTVKVPDASQTAQGMLRQLVPESGSGDPVDTYVQICKSATVAENTASRLGMGQMPDFRGMTNQQMVRTLMGMVTISNVLKTNIISVTAKSNDPQLAADLANAWAQCFIGLNLDLSHESARSKREFLEQQADQIHKRLNNPSLQLNEESKTDQLLYAQILENLQQARLEETVDDAGIVVVDAAVKPERPISPQKTRAVLLALLLGLALGLQAAFLMERIQDRVKEEEQLKRVTGLPNYAIVPDFREDYPESLQPPSPAEKFNPKYLINNAVFQHSFYRESFKVLRTNLTLSQADKPLKVLAVLSPGPEEGKTLVNANLAITLAQSGKKTLLIDSDLRKSSVRKVFGLENGIESGLPLALTGQKAWHEMVRPSGVEFLDLLPNTVAPPNPAELLGSTALKKLIEELKDEYDYVVFDGAPVLPVTDSVVLSTLLDGVVLMARFNETRASNVRQSLEHLRRVGARVVGTILNHVPLKRGLYGYGYGYGYGYSNYRYAPEKSPETTSKTKG